MNFFLEVKVIHQVANDIEHCVYQPSKVVYVINAARSILLQFHKPNTIEVKRVIRQEVESQGEVIGSSKPE